VSGAAARVRALEKHLARPLPRPKGLHLYPEPQLVRPAFPLSAFSLATKEKMLAEVRMLKGEHSAQESFIFDLTNLSLTLRCQLLAELQASREEPVCPSQPAPR
jgi:hypothetical protein